MIAQVIPLKKMPRNATWFDYQVDPSIHKALAPGDLVAIPFRNQTIQGIVYRLTKQSANKNLKKISNILEKKHVPTTVLETLLWFSKYYAVALPTVVYSFIPPKPQRNLTYTEPKMQKVTQVYEKCTVISLPQTTGAAIQLLSSEQHRADVYFSYIKHALQQKKTVVIFFPTVYELSAYYHALPPDIQSCITPITHSQNKTAAWEHWQRAKMGGIFFATRIAGFYPFPKNTISILDQSERSEYKQTDQNPRYSLWHVLDNRMSNKHFHSSIYTSWAPKIEHYTQYKKNTRACIERPENKPAQLHYISKTSPEHTNTVLRDKILEHQNILLFNNRIGSATTLQCRDCGWFARCPHDQKLLKVHTTRGILSCHECRHTQNIPATCPECASILLDTKGVGTEALEKIVTKLNIPHNITRLDSIATNLPKLQQHTKNVVIGSDYALKRLPLHLFDACMYTNADTETVPHDFRSTEHVYQRLSMIRYRLAKQSIVYIHTHNPDHELWQRLQLPYDNFWQSEMRMRKKFSYPPYTKLIKLLFSDTDEQHAHRQAQKLYATLQTVGFSNIHILPPQRNTPYREHKKYYVYILVKTTHTNMQSLETHIPSNWLIDRDPETL